MFSVFDDNEKRTKRETIFRIIFLIFAQLWAINQIPYFYAKNPGHGGRATTGLIFVLIFCFYHLVKEIGRLRCNPDSGSQESPNHTIKADEK